MYGDCYGGEYSHTVHLVVMTRIVRQLFHGVQLVRVFGFGDQSVYEGREGHAAEKRQGGYGFA